MRYRRYARGMSRSETDPDLNGALEAMTAEELRVFLREALERLDDEPRSEWMDALIAAAAKGSGGWKPPSPTPTLKIVSEVKDFVEAARAVGEAEASKVDHYLRQGKKAFHARDYATTRDVYVVLIPAICDGTIYLGQHETIDDVLTVSEHECAFEYFVSVYMTTPLTERVDALRQALETLRDVAKFWRLFDHMERVAAEPLPDLMEFLPLWVEYLEQQPLPDNEWEGNHERWLREAVERVEGVAGLERIALKTETPDAFRTWCKAHFDSGDWTEALRAYDMAVDRMGSSHWLGEILDGAALSAQELERSDVTQRLEAAWRGAPSFVRLLRWLGAGTPTETELAKRVSRALEQHSDKAASQVGLLQVLSGDIEAATKSLVSAPAQGWKQEDHPGRVLFPAFAGLLAGGKKSRLSAQLFATLGETPRDTLDMDWPDGNKPKLATPTIIDLLITADSSQKLNSKDRTGMLEAMRAAATNRVDEVLDEKRRSRYPHAATLVACCLELAPFVGKEKEITDWVADVRGANLRFAAFQRELKEALVLISD